nr:MAG TPA: Single strand binding protein [Caudoviricetes sp.]
MLNCVVIAGRMVRDPELRRTGSGKAVTSFTVACDRDFKNQQTGEKEVDFFDCVAWGAAGENAARYLIKGQMAMVTGRLQIRQYTDKNGQKRKQTEILVSSLYFCGNREANSQPNAGGSAAHNAPSAPQFVPVECDDDQLPY